MKRTLTTEIINKKEKPIIGIVGSERPTRNYTDVMGIQAGYELRKYIDSAKGTIFTGGVRGVGIDAYRGVINFCTKRGTKDPSYDRFFVLVPEYVDVKTDFGIMTIPYKPPAEYVRLAQTIPRNSLSVVVAGKDMQERRQYVADIADALVVVNGGLGTLDEAFNMLRASKNVVVLAYTGGSTYILSRIKDGNLDAKLRQDLEEEGFNVNEQFDTGLIHVAHDIEGMLQHLYRIL